jgi:hypothetical protein
MAQQSRTNSVIYFGQRPVEGTCVSLSRDFRAMPREHVRGGWRQQSISYSRLTTGGRLKCQVSPLLPEEIQWRGTEFSGAETGGQNPLERPLLSCRDRQRQKQAARSPQKKASFRSFTVWRFGKTGWWRRKGPSCQLPSQSSNQSPTLEPGTEFFDAETAARIRHFLRDFSSRDRILQRI